MPVSELDYPPPRRPLGGRRPGILVAFAAFVPAASATYIPPPTVSAAHAFVGDPLFGLQT